MRAALLVVAAAAALSGCGPWLYAASVPPPGAIGRLHTDHEWAELTQGSALAFRCEDAGPCERARATSDDPEIADVRPASLARLELAAWAGMQQEATFVIIGKNPGTTRIRVVSADGDVNLKVTVLPPP
jgi:hypothetical protein